MKRIVSATLAILLLTMNAMAQEEPQYRNSLSLSEGFGTIPEAAYMLGGIFGTAFSVGQAKLDGLSTTGCIGIEYYHGFGTRWEIGCVATGENVRCHWLRKTTDDVYAPDRSNDTVGYFFSLMPAAKCRWALKTNWNFYSKLAVGAMMGYSPSSEEDAFQAIPSVQLVPVGFEAGKNHWRGFAEIGAGMQGSLIGGVKYRF